MLDAQRIVENQKELTLRFIKPVLWGSGVFFALIAHASELPYITGGVESGSQSPWNAGLWWPAFHRNNNYFFADMDANYASTEGNGAIELGGDYRQQLASNSAWGAYGFAGYNRSTTGQSFFTLNPGIEWLNRAWHVSWNLYVPVSATTQGSGDWVWANSLGIYDYTHFQAHTQYDQLVETASSTGTGTDVIASYRFHALANLKASLGAYYFNMDTHAPGYVAMLTSPVMRHTSVNLAFTHDPLTSNSVVLGVTLHFGHQQDQDTHWMNETVQHNLPAVTTGNTIPIETGYRASGQNQMQADNVWFFNTTGTAYDSGNGIQNCTYEHPCSSVSSTTLENIATSAENAGFRDNPSIYLAPGHYTAPFLIVYGNESLIGRTSDYARTATGENRPTLTTNQVVVDASNNNQINTIENLQLLNNGDGYAAIALINTEQAILNNLAIGVSNASVFDENYAVGLLLDHVNSVSLNDSTIIANNYLTGDFLDIMGINDFGADHFTIENSTINTAVYGGNSINSQGLNVSDNGNITIKNSFFNQTAEGLGVNAINVMNAGSGVTAAITLENSTVTATAEGNGNSANNFTLQGNSSATVSDSTLNASLSSAGTNQNALGVQLYDNAAFTLNNSVMSTTANSTTGQSAATNIFAFDDSQLALTNSTLTATGNSALVTGSTNITAENNAVVTVSGGQLTTTMAGGPTSGEPSGAVALWAVNNAKMTVNNADITAISKNNETGAVALQTQDNAAATINNSVLSAYLEYGNITNTNSSVVVSGNASTIAINDSQILADTAGVTSGNLILATTANTSVMTLTNDLLMASNRMTSSGADPVLTIGAAAENTSTIYLNNPQFNLMGDNVENTKSYGGQIIQ